MSAKTQALRQPLRNLHLLPPVVVDEATPYADVLARLREEGRGSVIITRAGKVSGVFTERDYLYKHSLERVDANKPIGELMSTHPVTVGLDSPIGDAVQVMHDKKFRNLPIVDAQGQPRGLLTVGGIIRYLAESFPREVMNQPPTLQVTDHQDGA